MRRWHWPHHGWRSGILLALLLALLLAALWLLVVHVRPRRRRRHPSRPVPSRPVGHAIGHAVRRVGVAGPRRALGPGWRHNASPVRATTAAAHAATHGVARVLVVLLIRDVCVGLETLQKQTQSRRRREDGNTCRQRETAAHKRAWVRGLCQRHAGGCSARVSDAHTERTPRCGLAPPCMRRNGEAGGVRREQK